MSGDSEPGREGGITCHEAAERVYEFLDGELEAERMERIRQHIEVCRRCWPYFNFERIFLDHIRSRGMRPERSQELEEKVRHLLNGLQAEVES